MYSPFTTKPKISFMTIIGYFAQKDPFIVALSWFILLCYANILGETANSTFKPTTKGPGERIISIFTAPAPTGYHAVNPRAPNPAPLTCPPGDTWPTLFVTEAKREFPTGRYIIDFVMCIILKFRIMLQGVSALRDRNAERALFGRKKGTAVPVYPIKARRGEKR